MLGREVPTAPINLQAHDAGELLGRDLLIPNGDDLVVDEYGHRCLPLVQMEEADGIAGKHEVALVVRHAVKSLVDDLARVRPIAGDVGKVASPQQRVHAGVVPQAYSHSVVEESPKVLAAEVLAWPSLEGLQPPLLVDELHVAIVMVIDLPQG